MRNETNDYKPGHIISISKFGCSNWNTFVILRPNIAYKVSNADEKKKMYQRAMIFLQKFCLFLVRAKLLSLSSVAGFFVVYSEKQIKVSFKECHTEDPSRLMNGTPQCQYQINNIWSDFKMYRTLIANYCIGDEK